jgi:excisionase family DNA binding protein
MERRDDRGGDELLRADDAARVLAVSRTKIWDLIWSHQIPTVRIGRMVRIKRSDLEEWIEAQVR